jgi:hypothetical protein
MIGTDTRILAKSPMKTRRHQRDRNVISGKTQVEGTHNMRITLFGVPAIIVDGKRYEHRSRKAMALLAYLAMRADDRG